MINDERLQSILESVQQNQFPKKRYKLRAGFYRSRSLKHTIAMRFGTVTVRIADSFRSVPEDIIRILGYILFTKLHRQRVDTELRKQYRNYVQKHILPNYETYRRPVSKNYTPQGRVYNLSECFDRLNREFFDNHLPKPVIGWSLHRSIRRLGFYSRERNLLVISRIFDSRRVPLPALNYLLYHEMLHIRYPAELRNGRNIIHSREFKEKERSFPGYKDIDIWLKKNLRSL